MEILKNDADEVAKKVKELYMALVRRDTYEKDAFDFSKYMWCLGYKNFAALGLSSPIKSRGGKIPTLFSIPVYVDLVDTNKIELWENITDSL